MINGGTPERFLAPVAGERTGAPRDWILAFEVELELLVNHVFIQTGAKLFLQAVSQGELHLFDATVLHKLGQQGTRFATFVIADEILDHFDREPTGKIEHRVVKEKGDELFHRGLRRGVTINFYERLLISRKRYENQGRIEWDWALFSRVNSGWLEGPGSNARHTLTESRYLSTVAK